MQHSALRLALQSTIATAAVLGAHSPTPAKIPRRELEALVEEWMEARPRTYFQEWDPAVRESLMERAADFGEMAQGSLDDVVEILWKKLRKCYPKAKHGFDTPYGTATWLESGRGGRKSGLVIGLHDGANEFGEATRAAEMWKVKGHLCLYPQAVSIINDSWNRVHGEKLVLTLIEIAKVQHEVDPDRLYVMGFAMGGNGAWAMAGRHPDLFAGGISASGVIMASPRANLATKEEVRSLQHGLLPNLRNTAFYFYSWTHSGGELPGTHLAAWDRLQELHAADADGYDRFRFTLHEGGVYDFPPGEPETGIQFVTESVRDPFPTTLVWEYAKGPYPLPEPDDLTERHQKHWYSWLHHDSPPDRMRLRAQRDGNEFDVEIRSGQQGTLTVAMNPSMVDVEREVIVRVNGEERYRGHPVPSYQTVFDTLDARLDRRLIFDRKVTIPLDSSR